MSDLVQIVDAALASASRRSGRHLVCRPGCNQCCNGVFPISHQDAARLRDGLALLSETDPARASRLRARTAESIARVAPNFPGNATSGLLTEDDEGSEAFQDFANDEPCPVLDPITGTCDLYEYRPILCRTFGPAARTEEGGLAHCELCYTEATSQEIAACELDSSIPDLETASNDAFNSSRNLSGETIVAYALRGK